MDRHHVLRQMLGEESAQLGVRGTALRRSGGVGDQLPLPLGVGRRQDDRGLDSGVAQEGRLDLPQLDPEAAHLDLVVQPAEEFDLPRRGEAGEVAGPVEPLPGLPRKRVRDELERRLLRPVEVAAGEPHPAHHQLPHRPDRQRQKLAVDDVGEDVPHRPADGDLLLPPGEDRHGGEDRRLGRPVAVEELPPGRPARRELRRAGLAADADRHAGCASGLPAGPRGATG